MCLTMACGVAWGQYGRPPYIPSLPPPPKPATSTGTQLKPIHPKAPPPGFVRIDAVDKEKDGTQYHLKGNVEIETSDMMIKADEVDYDEATSIAKARGNVRFEHYTNGEKLNADHVEYNTDSETGKFYEVNGTYPAKIDARPGILTSSNPFYFQGKWAERIEDKYVLHDGFITDCKFPGAWWVLRGPVFDISPHNRAIAYRSIFWLRGIPMFYAPAYYKSLKKYPRQSGFLTPNIGNSTRRGKMVGVGYYWAINRSYDLMYRNQYFSERGFAHTVDFRGKVTKNTDFGAVIYGVNDKGIKIGDSTLKQGGVLASLTGRSILGHGWEARGEINYLSSFAFRQNFTESFYESIFAESNSVAFVTRHWSSFGTNIVYENQNLYQLNTSNSEDKLTVRKLPEFQFISRERRIWDKVPLYFSLESAAGLLRRAQPLYATRDFVDRVDFAPRVMTNLYWNGFSLVPAFSIRETHYGSSFTGGQITGANLLRSSREFTLDLGLPSFARIFKAPKWTGGDKLKHVIEPRASFRDIKGIDDFSRIIRFDETDILANTRELEVSLTNRLYKKEKDGQVNEMLTWQIVQRRYFDPTFGGALVPNNRNVFLNTVDLTGYAFLDQPRNYSPVVSALRYSHKIGVEWRTDYDPLRSRIVNSGFTADYRADAFFVSAGHNMVRNDTVLSPNSNQFRVAFGVGRENRRGWNAGSNIFYDYRQQHMQFSSTQVTYNTDCCGFSVQYRRQYRPPQFGGYESIIRFSFAVANIGSFGTLKRQERIF